MADVIFLSGLQADYNALTPKANTTFYECTDTHNFYLGETKLSNAADLAAAVQDIAKNAADIVTINGTLTKLEADENTSGSIRNIIKGYFDEYDASDVGIADAGGYFTSENVEGALQELAEASSGGVASKTVYITETAGTSSDPFSKRYGVYQGSTGSSSSPVVGEKLADIDIPKDMVVESGTVGTVTTADVPYAGAQVGDKYIDLVIANATSDHIYIPANSLVDVYTAEQNATQVQLVIDANNEISATIVAGSIDTAELANSAVTTAKIADDAVTADKVAISAHTESQTAGADGLAISVTTTDGQVSGVSGSIAAGTYDAAGAAAAVLGTASDSASDVTVYGVKAKAQATEDLVGTGYGSGNTVKDYIDNSIAAATLTWGVIPTASAGE